MAWCICQQLSIWGVWLGWYVRYHPCDVLNIPQQNPLKYGFSGIEYALTTHISTNKVVIIKCTFVCLIFHNKTSLKQQIFWFHFIPLNYVILPVLLLSGTTSTHGQNWFHNGVKQVKMQGFTELNGSKTRKLSIK